MAEMVIRLSRENAAKILTTESIPPDVLEEKLEEYKPGNLYDRTFGYKHYFIPSHITFTGNNLGWTIVRSDALERCFTYDADKVETEFVEITQHSAI